MANEDTPTDYYDILNLRKGASETEIKKAYRKLAVAWHPDKNPDNKDEAEKRFQCIAEAYDVLSDETLRDIYDKYGQNGLDKNISSSSYPTNDNKTYDQYGDDNSHNNNNRNHRSRGKRNASEIFESFFGPNDPFAKTFSFRDTATPSLFNKDVNVKPKNKKSPSIHCNIPCKLEELYHGCTKMVKITRKRFKDGSYNCEDNILGGDGSLDLVDDVKMLSIVIRPGWKDGIKVTFPCEGDAGIGIIPSDIIFTIRETPHSLFTRDSDDSSKSSDGSTLIFPKTISLTEALTGCHVKVPTLDGTVITLSCYDDDVIYHGFETCIPGEGMPRRLSSSSSCQKNEADMMGQQQTKEEGDCRRGDLIVRFDVRFPRRLNDETKQIIRDSLRQATF